jgi:hypothetical protein
MSRMYGHREIGVTHGVRILNLLDDPLQDELVEKIAEALGLIAEADPRRYSRLLRDLDAIAVLNIPSPLGAYMPGARTCYIGHHFLCEYPMSNLALLIAHEGTHARLDRLHLVSWCRAAKYRQEHRCLQEELALAARFPRDRFPEIENWIANRAAESKYSQKVPRA